MKLLLTIRDEDIGLDSKKMNDPEKREAARAVIVDGKKIALVFLSKRNYHKLPGGGAEKGETLNEALFREIREETGCTIKVIKEIGKITEYRSHLNMIQTSHCFLAKKLEQHEPELEDEEKEDGFELEWHSIEDAIKMISSERPDTYDGKFIVIRDKKFLQDAKNIIDLRHPGL